LDRESGWIGSWQGRRTGLGVLDRQDDQVVFGIQQSGNVFQPIGSLTQNRISSSRRGLNVVYLVLAKETKSHVQARE